MTQILRFSNFFQYLVKPNVMACWVAVQPNHLYWNFLYFLITRTMLSFDFICMLYRNSRNISVYNINSVGSVIRYVQLKKNHTGRFAYIKLVLYPSFLSSFAKLNLPHN